MQMMLEFDINADIIDVPQFIIENRELYRSRFLKWLYDKNIHHKYWVKFPDGDKGLCYRADAFVEWLNKKILKGSTDRAEIVLEEVDIDAYRHLPSVFF